MTDEYEQQAREILLKNVRGDIVCNYKFLLDEMSQAIRKLGQERDAIFQSFHAQSIHQHDLIKERNEYERLAESWMNDCDKLKNKYESLIAVTANSERDELKAEIKGWEQIHQADERIAESLNNKLSVAVEALEEGERTTLEYGAEMLNELFRSTLLKIKGDGK